MRSMTTRSILSPFLCAHATTFLAHLEKIAPKHGCKNAASEFWTACVCVRGTRHLTRRYGPVTLLTLLGVTFLIVSYQQRASHSAAPRDPAAQRLRDHALSKRGSPWGRSDLLAQHELENQHAIHYRRRRDVLLLVNMMPSSIMCAASEKTAAPEIARAWCARYGVW